jgi:hypothetical protein
MSSAANNVESAIVAGNSSPLLGSTDPSGSETHHSLADGSDVACESQDLLLPLLFVLILIVFHCLAPPSIAVLAHSRLFSHLSLRARTPLPYLCAHLQLPTYRHSFIHLFIHSFAQRHHRLNLVHSTAFSAPSKPPKSSSLQSLFHRRQAVIYPHLLPFNPDNRIESREYKLTPFSRSAYFTPPSSPGRAALEASGAIMHEINNSVFPPREVLDGLGITGLGLESNMQFLNVDYEEVFENEKQAKDDGEDDKVKKENRTSDDQYLAIYRAFMDMQSMDTKLKNEPFEADGLYPKSRTNTTESNYGGFADNNYANEYNYDYLYNVNNDDENEVIYDAKYKNFQKLASACYPLTSSAWSSSAFSSTSVGSSEEASTFASTSVSTTSSFPALDAPFRYGAGAPAFGNDATGTSSSKSTSEGYFSDCEVSHPCFSSFSLPSDDNLSEASTPASPASGSAAALIGSGSYKWDSTPYTPLKISFKKDNKRKRDLKDELDSMLECASSSSDSSSFFSSCRQSIDASVNNNEDDDVEEINHKKQKKTKVPYVESEAVKKLKLSPALTNQFIQLHPNYLVLLVWLMPFYHHASDLQTFSYNIYRPTGPFSNSTRIDY